MIMLGILTLLLSIQFAAISKNQSPPLIIKVAVVTGAARGIGLAISKKFLEEGYRIAILDIDQKTLSQTMKQDFDTNNVLGLECDVAEPDQVDPSVNLVVEEFGRIDVLVNNAGIAEFKPMLETSYDGIPNESTKQVRLPKGHVCNQSTGFVVSLSTTLV